MSNVVDWTSTAWNILQGRKIINVLCCGCRILLCIILLYMASQPWRCGVAFALIGTLRSTTATSTAMHVLQNKRIVDAKQRERIISSSNGLSTTPSFCKQRQRRHFHVLRTTWTRGEMKSILKIDFNTNTKIVLAVLKRFRGHKTNFKYQIR